MSSEPGRKGRKEKGYNQIFAGRTLVIKDFVPYLLVFECKQSSEFSYRALHYILYPFSIVGVGEGEISFPRD